MHAISSYRGNSQFRVIVVTDPQNHKPTNKQTNRQDWLQYTAPLSLARSVTTAITPCLWKNVNCVLSIMWRNFINIQILGTLYYIHFPLHLIFTIRTLQLIWMVENDAFHVTVKLLNMPFKKDRILIRNVYLLRGYTALKLLKGLRVPRWHFN